MRNLYCIYVVNILKLALFQPVSTFPRHYQRTELVWDQEFLDWRIHGRLKCHTLNWKVQT